MNLHTGFQLVSKLVTLNDLERSNDRRRALSLRYFSFCRIISLQQSGDETMSESCGRHRLLIHSARQVVQITATGEQVLTGARRMNSLAVLERRHDGQGLSIVVDRLALAVL